MSGDRLVHVIDDDVVVRSSLATLLEASGLSVIAYESALAFLSGLDQASSGCVVTDVRMPEVSGLELLRRLNGRLAQFPVIVLTGEADVPMAVEALKGGASDFIEKPYSAASILTAVGQALGRRDADRARESRRRENVQRLAGLSTREREVLDGLVAGHPNKEIARRLGISPRTVEVYRANVMIKAGAESLSELVRMALDAEAAEPRA